MSPKKQLQEIEHRKDPPIPHTTNCQILLQEMQKLRFNILTSSWFITIRHDGILKHRFNLVCHMAVRAFLQSTSDLTQAGNSRLSPSAQSDHFLIPTISRGGICLYHVLIPCPPNSEKNSLTSSCQHRNWFPKYAAAYVRTPLPSGFPYLEFHMCPQ